MNTPAQDMNGSALVATIARRMLIGALVLGALCVLSGCEARRDRYRVTITVDVNHTIYSGSSVQEFHCHQGGGVWGSMDVSQCNIAGEAVFVDLKNHGNLFLLFKGNHGDMSSAVEDMFIPRNNSAGAKTSGKWSVPVGAAPMMVTFKNPRDPLSVEKVDPSNLKDTLGPGVSIQSIVIEKSNEPITQGNLYKALPWLKGIGRNQIDGKSIRNTNNLSNILQKSDFVFGE